MEVEILVCPHVPYQRMRHQGGEARTPSRTPARGRPQPRTSWMAFDLPTLRLPRTCDLPPKDRMPMQCPQGIPGPQSHLPVLWSLLSS